MEEKILKEINDSIESVEKAMGEDNDYDKGYYDALYMVKNRIVLPIIHKLQE